MLVNTRREVERLADPDARLWARASAIARDAEEAAGYERACGVEAPFAWWACSARGRPAEQGDRWLVASKEGRLLVAVIDGGRRSAAAHSVRDDLAQVCRRYSDFELWLCGAETALRAAGPGLAVSILLAEVGGQFWWLGSVGFAGVYRVRGLTASRMASAPSAVPWAMRAVTGLASDATLIVGTDGALDVLGPWQLAAGSLQSLTPAAELVRLALARGSTDNCTAVVVTVRRE